MFEIIKNYPVSPYIAYAIPIFFLLIGIEIWVAHRRGKQEEFYNYSDSINDLSLGIYSRIFGIFYSVFFFFAYVWIYENYRLLDSSLDYWPAWVLGFLGVDFFYYWFHRASHEISVIWGSHDPHHQSEEYNFAVALRQGPLQGVFSGPFYWPLAFAGLHPIIYLTCSQFNTLYQFWIHTRTINRMGFLETFLNTPSHHRVHHGKNPKYIDRNHGGTLIIWDKLFGTFQPEEDEPVYGTVKPLASWNPMWATFSYWTHLWRLSGKTRSWWDKLRVWFTRPGWKPADCGPREAIPEVDAEKFKKYRPPVERATRWYTILHFVAVMPVTLQVIFMGYGAWSVTGVLYSLNILTALWTMGWLLENRERAWLFENLRLVLSLAVMAGLLAFQPGQNYGVLGMLAFYFLSLGYSLVRRTPPPETEDHPAPA